MCTVHHRLRFPFLGPSRNFAWHASFVMVSLSRPISTHTSPSELMTPAAAPAETQTRLLPNLGSLQTPCPFRHAHISPLPNWLCPDIILVKAKGKCNRPIRSLQGDPTKSDPTSWYPNGPHPYLALYANRLSRVRLPEEWNHQMEGFLSTWRHRSDRSFSITISLEKDKTSRQKKEKGTGFLLVKKSNVSQDNSYGIDVQITSATHLSHTPLPFSFTYSHFSHSL